jgi:hypothetical protein
VSQQSHNQKIHGEKVKMSLYKRGNVWWYKFRFAGVTIRESTGLSSEYDARDVEDKRRIELKEGRAGIVRRKRPAIFSAASEAWLKAKRASGAWKSPKTEIIEKTNLVHLKAIYGSQLLGDIDHEAVTNYWESRRKEKASDKTVSLELGTLRSILLYHDLDSQWASIRKKVKLKPARDVGRKITADEELCLMRECRKSRSRSLPVIVTLALQTGMRSANCGFCNGDRSISIRRSSPSERARRRPGQVAKSL